MTEPAGTTPDNAATSSDTADSTALREQYSAAMREHYLCTSRDEADADGNLPCRCGDWREPGPMGSDEDDWDSHIADAVLALRDREMERLWALVNKTLEYGDQQQATIERIRRLIEVWRDAPDPLVRAMAADLASAFRGPQPPAPDDGPTVAECAADDKRWPLEKAGE